MNIYTVVEGEVGEKQVYRAWIPCVNSHLHFAASFEDVKDNNFFIMHGGGYPQYFSLIARAIEDVLTMTNVDGLRLFDRLVISVDSEENTYDEKKREIIEFIESELQVRRRTLDYKVIVQYFCLEAWCLGNRKIQLRAQLEMES